MVRFIRLKRDDSVFSAVNDESSVEDLMPAVLGVDLRKAKDLAVCKFPAKGIAQLCKIFNLLRAEGKPSCRLYASISSISLTGSGSW